MAEYIKAKFALFRNQESLDLAIFGDEPSFHNEIRARSCRGQVEFFRDAGNFKKSRLLGRHNRLNMEAAWLAVRRFGVSLEQARQAAENFAPLPHRLESVAEIDGVTYVNDSKCTTVAALRVALESFITEEGLRPVLLLAGGVFKGGDLASLRPLLERGVKAVGLFGGNRDKFEAAWQGAASVSHDAKLADAVRRLRALAAPGDVVLLAPATSSYDQYNNYKERGQDFINSLRKPG
jgi:UDP-N-acetylmuramoylalanine--D-glutamate ligase